MKKYIAILLLAFSYSAAGSAATWSRFDCVVTTVHSVASDGTIVNDTKHFKESNRLYFLC